MDDLNLYAPSHERLKQLTNLVEQFSNDINLNFGPDKCNVINIYKGKYEFRELQVESGWLIEAIGETDCYKYLGYEKARYIAHSAIKQNLRKEYLQESGKCIKKNLTAETCLRQSTPLP